MENSSSHVVFKATCPCGVFWALKHGKKQDRSPITRFRERGERVLGLGKHKLRGAILYPT